MSRKIGRRSIRPLYSSTAMTRRVLTEGPADLMLIVAEKVRDGLRPGIVDQSRDNRWVTWRPVGPITEQVSEPPDLWMRNLIEYSVRQPWETRYIGRRHRATA